MHYQIPVVICFHFTTFAVLETAFSKFAWDAWKLWFAFILLPLPYWKQRRATRPPTCPGCDLLSFYYLCRTGNSTASITSTSWRVVICFHFTTFAVLETAFWRAKPTRPRLWFAFILLPLPYWKQLISSSLCRPAVVICFHFTTFAVLETALFNKNSILLMLWFAFILLPLPYWKQPTSGRETEFRGCDLLSFYYLCRTGNSVGLQVSHIAGVVICFHFTTFAVLETARLLDTE